MAKAEQAVLSEHLLITAPKAGARVHHRSVTIAGKVTNPVNGYPMSVKVQIGSAHKTATVSATGAWSVKMAVSKGHHKIIASMTDPGGVHHVATRKFVRR
jgi:hypothetical protein